MSSGCPVNVFTLETPQGVSGYPESCIQRTAKVFAMTEKSDPAGISELLDLASDQALFGRMNDPSAASFVRGICGDEMEFYLVVSSGRLTEVRYWTDGCEITRACAAWVARAVTGRTIMEALQISPADILRRFPEIPEAHRHCPILATCTFFQAVGDYLLKP